MGYIQTTASIHDRETTMPDNYCLLVLLMIIVQATCLKFLMVPMAINSHYMMFNSLGTALVSKGHSVSVVAPDNSRISLFHETIDIHLYRGVGEVSYIHSPEIIKLQIDAGYAESKLEQMALMAAMLKSANEIQIQECKHLLENQTLRDRVMSLDFDFAIVDNFVMPCLYNYPVSLGLTYLMFFIPQGTLNYRLPDLASFMPDPLSGQFSDEMGYIDRLQNTIFTLVFYLLMDNHNPIDMTKYPPGKEVTMTMLQQDALLWFWPDDLAVFYPRPKMPNVISIGDVLVSDGEPLPAKYQQFLDTAVDGAIIFAMGSVVDQLPEGAEDKLCATFSKLPLKVIWKAKNKPACMNDLADKLLIVQWMPQKDVLAHSNIKLFITHCGLNSVLQSVYNAKPMIGFPVHFDLKNNARAMAKLQYGINMDILHFSTEKLITNIQHVMTDHTIQTRIKLGCNLLRDKPDTAADRIDYWVNHVDKYGGEHLRTIQYTIQ